MSAIVMLSRPLRSEVSSFSSSVWVTLSGRSTVSFGASTAFTWSTPLTCCRWLSLFLPPCGRRRRLRLASCRSEQEQQAQSIELFPEHHDDPHSKPSHP